MTLLFLSALLSGGVLFGYTQNLVVNWPFGSQQPSPLPPAIYTFVRPLGNKTASYYYETRIAEYLSIENEKKEAITIYNMQWDSKIFCFDEIFRKKGYASIDIEIKLPKRKTVLALANFYFDYESHQLHAEDMSKFHELITSLQTPGATLVLIARADKIGSNEANILLASNRGLAVAKELQLQYLAVKPPIILALGNYGIVQVDGQFDFNPSANRVVEALVVLMN